MFAVFADQLQTAKILPSKFLSIASCRQYVIKSLRPSAKIKSRKFSGRPNRENFSPRKFLAIRYIYFRPYVVHVPLTCHAQTYVGPAG